MAFCIIKRRYLNKKNRIKDQGMTWMAATYQLVHNQTQQRQPILNLLMLVSVLVNVIKSYFRTKTFCFSYLHQCNERVCQLKLIQEDQWGYFDMKSSKNNLVHQCIKSLWRYFSIISVINSYWWSYNQILHMVTIHHS